jgi:hypothetical protein
MKQRKKRRIPSEDLLQWGVPRILGAGYGLLSQKAVSPRWPEFVIAAMVIRKYRKRSSFWFMLKAAIRGVLHHTEANGELQSILARLVGSTPRQMQQLAGIYEAVRLEQGTAAAVACVVEIVRITNEKRRDRLSWYRPVAKKTLAKNLNEPKTAKPGRSKRNRRRIK